MGQTDVNWEGTAPHLLLPGQDAHTGASKAAIARRRLTERIWIYSSLVIVDTMAVGIGFVIAFLLRFKVNLPWSYSPAGSVVGGYDQLTIALIPVWLLIFRVYQLYNFRFLFGGLEEYARLFNACTTGTMLVMIVSFLIPELVVARGWLLLSWLSISALAGMGRFAVRRAVYRMRFRGHFLTTMLIVGADGEGKAVAEQLVSNPRAGVRLVGFVDDNVAKGTEVLPGLFVVGATTDAQKLVDRLGVQELTVSSSALHREELLDVFHAFGNAEDVNVRLSSGLFEIMTTGLRVKNVGTVPLLSVNRVRLTGADVVLKQVLNYVGATLGLIALAPLFLLIAIAIKRDSPGPILYRRRVLGVGGKEFDAFKFRTMVVDAEEVLENDYDLKTEYEKDFKLKDDPRVTAIGGRLRKSSLDELPQLMNVLRGEMSLVGPRMIVKEELSKYGKWGLNLLTVKPGITGLWQVNGRTDVGYEERVRLDIHYVRNYTIWLDLQILFQTIPAVLRKKGAY